jgi:glycosyltransferase involved in cell wall biosynthesis
MVRCSIIVPAFNAEKSLDNCLQALLAQSISRDQYEILVVDDGSHDSTAAIASRYPVTLLHQTHAGPACARNLGAREARAPFLLFTDADCEPVPTWAEAILRPLEADSRIAGCKGVYRTRQRGLIPRMAQVEFEEKYAHLRRQQSIDFVDTSSAAFRADAFWSAGGFDTSFHAASNEDTQLSFALVSQGWQLVFCDDAIVYHRHSETVAQYLRRKWRHGYWRVRVYRQYPDKMAGDSYTPRSTQVQMAAAVLSVASLLHPATRRVAVASGAAFLLATTPFVRRALGEGADVAAVVPPLLFLRALALASGLAVGVVDLQLRRAPVARRRCVRV